MYAKTVIFGIIATVIVLFVIIFIIVLGDKEAELGGLRQEEVIVNQSLNTVAPKDSGELVKLFNIRPGEVGRGATVGEIEGGGLSGFNFNVR